MSGLLSVLTPDNLAPVDGAGRKELLNKLFWGSCMVGCDALAQRFEDCKKSATGTVMDVKMQCAFVESGLQSCKIERFMHTEESCRPQFERLQEALYSRKDADVQSLATGFIQCTRVKTNFFLE